MVTEWSSTWFWSRLKAEQRAQHTERLPEQQQHVSVPQLRLVPEGSDRVHQVRCFHFSAQTDTTVVFRELSVTCVHPPTTSVCVEEVVIIISDQYTVITLLIKLII